MRVGFVSIGRMALPMAARLVAPGHEIAAADATERQALSFALASRARPAPAAGDAAHEAEVVITMPPANHAMAVARAAMPPAFRHTPGHAPGSRSLLPARRTPSRPATAPR